MTTKTNKQYRPRPDQFDESEVETSKVQYWKNGIMMTAQMSNDVAREMVTSRRAFVISEQAIGALDENGYSIA